MVEETVRCVENTESHAMDKLYIRQQFSLLQAVNADVYTNYELQKVYHQT